jgi:muramoyltetrapeptide carboxypeptidase
MADRPPASEGPAPSSGGAPASAAPKASTTAEDEAVTFASDLIRIDTSNRGGGDCRERPAAEYVAERLADAGLDPVLLEAAPGRANVVARIAGADPAAGGLLAHGHLDVVPAEPGDWARHPFSGERFAGLDPVVYPSAEDGGSLRHYLAGDDELRAADLRAALTDPSIAGIIFATGGYGAQRTLAAMDWDGLTGLPPKVLAGYSDVTAILEAAAARLGWASLHSPMVTSGGTTAAHYSFGSLLRTLMRPEHAMTIHFPGAVALTGGTGRGVTLGGNLTLLTSSLGTCTSLPARGGILLLEDANEEDYRVDRMLTQFRRSGYLDGVAGIIGGTFTGCGEPALIEAILGERLADLHVPLIAWANVGHGGCFQTFPVGIAAELDADAHTMHLLDPPLIPASPAGV